MIHRIYSSISTFKQVEFHAGLNILIAERTKDSNREQTRNAAGKSSTLEIIHYLLGADAPAKGVFAKKVFENQSLGMVFDLAGVRLNVERPTGTSKEKDKFYFHGEIPSFLREGNQAIKSSDRFVLSKVKWKKFLGEQGFGLNSSGVKFEPSFRSILSYFCRRDEIGGFAAPFYQSKEQKDWDRNVMIAFLLGLDWRILSKMEELRVEAQHLDKLKAELSNSGLVGQIVGKSSGIRAKLSIEENKLRILEEQVNSFQVLPHYKELEKEASLLAKQIADNSNSNFMDYNLIDQLRESLQSEHSPGEYDLERLYDAVGVQLPGVTLEKIESVKAFHRKVIANRKTHLIREIEDAEQRIDKRNLDSEQMDMRRQQIMTLLQTHGALDQYNGLQGELSRIRSEVEALRRQQEIAIKIEKGSAQLDVKRARLHQNLINDLDSRNDIIQNSVILYEQLSKSVSERSSVLEIEATKKGLSFEIKGGPDKSKGIREQQIFCFDMLLAILNSKKSHNLGFLVHDSHLFDAMDERQVANAIELGAQLSQLHGFQYIITMNSDRIPFGDFSKEFDFERYVLPVKLTDETDAGGLFGFRF